MTANTPSGTGATTPQTLDGAADYLVGLLADSEATPAEPEDEASDEIEAADADDVSDDVSEPSDEDGEEEYEASAEDKAEVEEESSSDYIEIDGEQITLDEVGKSYMRQSSYTKKMQELAEQRKQFDATQQQDAASLNAEREHLKKVLASLNHQEEQPINWVELAENDPLEYTRKRAMHDAKQAERSVAQAEQQRLSQLEAQQRHARNTAFVEQQKQKVVEHLPELAGEKGAQYRANIITYMQNSGYTNEELANLYDARAVIAFDKARKYDELTGKGTLKAKTVNNKPKVIRPGVQASSKGKATQHRKQAMQTARKSGSISDAVDALLS